MLTIFTGKQINLHILLLNMFFMVTIHDQIMMLFQKIYSPSCRQIGGNARGNDSYYNEVSSIFYLFVAYLLNAHYFKTKLWPLMCCILSFLLTQSMANCLILLWLFVYSKLALNFVGYGLPVFWAFAHWLSLFLYLLFVDSKVFLYDMCVLVILLLLVPPQAEVSLPCIVLC